MEGQLKGIRQIQTHPNYLQSNSTSHKWPFSAVAELIDNAYDPDARASNLDINYESFCSGPCLTFTDDGNGLDAEGMHKMFCLGYSHKKDIDVPKHLAVGQYGNGFKSGSMRLGRDAIVFSIKNNTKTIGFMSQTFLENTEAATVVVPIVSWNLANQIIPSADAEPSLRAILEHSIFTTTKELFEQFEKISEQMTLHKRTRMNSERVKGTRIIIYNLKKDASNRLEFDFMKEVNDIIIAEEYDLTHPAVNMDEPDDESDIPKHTYSLRAYCSILYMKPKLHIYLRGKKVQTLFVEKSLSKTERDTYKPKNVQLVPDKPIKITFGFNPKKNQYGMLMYYKNRLIKPYEKVGYQLKPDQRGVGVLGVVECNFIEPTHNKQDFLSSKVYSCLIKALGEKLNDYWNEKMGNPEGEIVDLVNPNPEEDIHPDDNWVQCDRCDKWRKLPPNANLEVVEQEDVEWFCEMNPDSHHSRCDIAEEPEDVDDARSSYKKTFKKRQQAAQVADYLRKKDEDARKRQERAKINEEKKRLQQEKVQLVVVEQQVATQEQQAKQAKEMEKLRQQLALQEKQLREQELQIQQGIAGSSTQADPEQELQIQQGIAGSSTQADPEQELQIQQGIAGSSTQADPEQELQIQQGIPGPSTQADPEQELQIQQGIPGPSTQADPCKYIGVYVFFYQQWQTKASLLRNLYKQRRSQENKVVQAGGQRQPI
ncbi:MORC family CW-type zinc finger protein 3-like [Amphiura filiformis]|uniref:MORC family CW-type zinc finger protein 3-like n=1 Tax=Amphiura filiformis TaxID=82378 RepID=UPI003B228180